MLRTILITALAATLFSLGGCADRLATPAAAPNNNAPVEFGELRQRATRLLVQAAEGDIDVVRCNALEALSHVDADRAADAARKSLRHESPLVRYAASCVAGDLRLRDASPDLMQLLNDNSPRVRLGAAYALARGGEKNCAAYLVAGLGSNDENLRCDAAYLIGKLGEPAAVKRLRLAQTREKSSKVLVHIDTALAMLGVPQSVERLMSDTAWDAVSRIIALQSLVELKNERTAGAFRLILNNKDNYLQMRLLAARGLGRLGDNSGYKLAYASLTYTPQKGDDQDVFSIRSLAALALGAIGDPKALPELRHMAETESDERIQVAAAYAICQIVMNKR